MKKLIFLFAFVAICFASQAQKKIMWPAGAGDFITKAETDTAIVASNRLTFIDYGTLDKAISLTVTVSKNLPEGSMLYILTKSDGTGRNVTFSTNFKSPVLSGTASKTKLATFIYRGTSFYLITTQQLD